jgi:hypothetical protein
MVPLVDYTGLWWSPWHPGWGFSIDQLPDHRLIVMWYVYDTDGQAVWYSLQPGS